MTTSPSQMVEHVYKLAEALKAASDALHATPFGAIPDLDALLDRPILPGDLDTLAQKVNASADRWQDRIDAEPVA